MKNKLAILILSFFSLFFASGAKASCATDLTNYFSQYVTQSTDSTGTHLTQTINFSGYSTFNGDPNCPMTYPQVSHRPQVLNQIGTTGGWYYSQTTYCATCQMSYYSTLTITTSAGVIYADDYGASVYCNVGGTFFNEPQPPPSLKVEIAYTRAVATGSQTNCHWNEKVTQEVCDMSTQYWCSAYTSPPDWPVNKINAQVYPPPAPTWFEAFTVCVTYGSPGSLQPWVCLPQGIAAEMYTPRPVLATCTYNP